MGFGKPFKAVPPRLGAHYRAKMRRAQRADLARAVRRATVVAAAVVVGAGIGTYLAYLGPSVSTAVPAVTQDGRSA